MHMTISKYKCPECKDTGRVYMTGIGKNGRVTGTGNRFPCMSCDAGRKYRHEGPQVFRSKYKPDVAYPTWVERPRTRGDCLPGGCNEARPCPFVSCPHHLYLERMPRGRGIKIAFPLLEPWEMKETCSLDVADRGGAALEVVGDLCNITRERVRQLEVESLKHLQEAAQDLDSGEIVPRIRAVKARFKREQGR